MEWKSEKGFTLIEVLIAMTMLGVGILGVATMQISSIGGNDVAINITQATSWGGDRLETIMSVDYATLNDDTGNGVAGLNDTDAAGLPADYGPFVYDHYQLFYNVAEDYPIAGCKTINVVVRRSDKGVVKDIALEFIRAESI